MKRKRSVEETLTDRVLAAITAAPNGLTDFELANGLGEFLSSINSSRNFLMNNGKVTRSGEHRPSGRGGTAAVWVVVA